MAKKAPGIGEKSDGRDANGRFIKGNKSNGGRKPMPKDIREAFEGLTQKAIAVINDILDNPGAKDSDKIKCVEIILDRVYGKPQQSVNVETDTAPRIVFVGMDDVAP